MMQTTEPLETERFRLGTSQFFTRLVYLHGTLPIASVLVLVLISVALAFALDSRFAILALMIVFLIAPLAMAWLYLSYGFHTDASFNVAWHTLTLHPDSIDITLLKPVYEQFEQTDPDADEPRPESGEQESKQEEQEADKREYERIVGWERGKTIRYGADRLRPYLTGGDGITIPLAGGKGFIAVPRSCFGSEERYLEFVNRISTLRECETAQC